MWLNDAPVSVRALPRLHQEARTRPGNRGMAAADLSPAISPSMEDPPVTLAPVAPVAPVAAVAAIAPLVPRQALACRGGDDPVKGLLDLIIGTLPDPGAWPPPFPPMML